MALGAIAVLAVASIVGAPKAARAQSTACASALPGVTGVCKPTVGGNDVLWPAATCPAGQKCTMTRGSQLCAAEAAKIGQNGTFLCVASANDCGTPLDASISATVQVCPPSQQCCTSKSPTASPAGTSGAGKPGTPKQLPDPLGGVNIPTFIGNVIRTFAGIAGTIALIMFVYGGIMLILSGGESAKVQKGKQILINASIGLVLIFSAYTFVSAIIGAILAE